MDQQQQQLYQYHLQSSQSYDQSQIQAYDQSAHSYYAYNQDQQYGYYPQPYATDSQNQQQPTSIHPPGVPIPPEPAHTVGPDYHLQAPHNGYYPHAVHGVQQQQQHLGYPDSAQAGSNLFQMAGNMDAAAQGSVEQWQVNNGGFGPGPVRPSFYHEAQTASYSTLLGSAQLVYSPP